MAKIDRTSVTKNSKAPARRGRETNLPYFMVKIGSDGTYQGEVDDMGFQEGYYPQCRRMGIQLFVVTTGEKKVLWARGPLVDRSVGLERQAFADVMQGVLCEAEGIF